jgi:hypothetical protein
MKLFTVGALVVPLPLVWFSALGGLIRLIEVLPFLVLGWLLVSESPKGSVAGGVGVGLSVLGVLLVHSPSVLLLMIPLLFRLVRDVRSGVRASLGWWVPLLVCGLISLVYVAPAFFAFGASKLDATAYSSFLQGMGAVPGLDPLSQVRAFDRVTALFGPLLLIADFWFLIPAFAVLASCVAWGAHRSPARDRVLLFVGFGAALLLFSMGFHWVLFEYAAKWHNVWVLVWGVPLIVLGAVALQGVALPRMRFPLLGVLAVVVLLGVSASSWGTQAHAITEMRMPEALFEPIDWVKAYVPSDGTVLALQDWPAPSASLFERPAGSVGLLFLDGAMKKGTTEVSCLDGFVPSRGFSFTHCARTRSLLGFDVVVVPQTTGGFASSFSRALADFRNLLARSGFVVAHRTTAHEIWRKKTG